jgi:hypothetical protein
MPLPVQLFCLYHHNIQRYKKGQAVPVHAMKAHTGSRDKLHSFLTSALNWTSMVNITPWLIYHQEKIPVHIHEEAGPQNPCICVEKRKISCPCQDLNLTSSIPQPSHYNDYAKLAPPERSMTQKVG